MKNAHLCKKSMSYIVKKAALQKQGCLFAVFLGIYTKMSNQNKQHKPVQFVYIRQNTGKYLDILRYIQQK